MDENKEKVYDNPRDGKIVETINLNNLPNLINTNHEHVGLPDPTDETEDYLAYKCQSCQIGWLVNKH